MSCSTPGNLHKAALALSGWLPALLLLTAAADAQELEAAYSLGARHSDNINLVSEGGLDETIAHTGFSLALVKETRRISTDLRGTLDYYEYFDNTYDGELVGAVDALLNVNLIGDRLTWFLQENYGRALFDPFQPASPENWENVNFITTGPDVTLLRMGRNESGIALRYSQLDYETRPFDNERQSARFWIGREIRRDQQLSANLDFEEVEFGNGVTPEYSRRSVFLLYDADLGRNVISVQAGYTEQEILSQTGHGVLFNLSWIREVSSRSQLSLNVGRSFADQGRVFRYQQDIGRDVDAIGDLTENGSPFILKNVDIGYALDADRTTFSVRLGASEQEYEQPGLDREDAHVGLHVARHVTRSLSLMGELQFYRREFVSIDRNDDTVSGSAGVGLHLTASLELSLLYSRTSRDSNIPGSDFDENRGDLTLTYVPAWAR